jgi:hypothetical protein
MPGDDDIARLLPEPPPPRAARREAAIEAAMRRFDGEAPPPVARPARAPVWARVGRTQVAAFASVALVAVVGIPLALTVLEREHAANPPAPAPVAVAQKALPPAPARTAIPGEVRFILQKDYVGTPTRNAEPAPEPTPAPVVVPEDCGKGDCEARTEPRPVNRFAELKAVPMPAPTPEPVPSQEIAVTDRRAAAPSGYLKMADASDETSVVVTGSRIRSPAAARRRGDWNACTVNDPEHSLAGCGQLIDPGAGGAAGQAAAHVADGLSRAWSGDVDGAISAFDAAIALRPRLAIAFLNRGLAYQRQGETGRALADLNRAVRYAPSAARGYYNRSQLLDQAGDAARARADADRAVALDPRYRAALE